MTVPRVSLSPPLSALFHTLCLFLSLFFQSVFKQRKLPSPLAYVSPSSSSSSPLRNTSLAFTAHPSSSPITSPLPSSLSSLLP